MRIYNILRCGKPLKLARFVLDSRSRGTKIDFNVLVQGAAQKNLHLFALKKCCWSEFSPLCGRARQKRKRSPCECREKKLHKCNIYTSQNLSPVHYAKETMSPKRATFTATANQPSRAPEVNEFRMREKVKSTKQSFCEVFVAFVLRLPKLPLYSWESALE